MNETFRLGTVAGVRVGVNWSVLVIAALLFTSLAFGRFPLLYPGRSLGSYAVAGALAAVVFFLSLLAHELAHAIVAQRNQIAVGGITLWMLGGMAKLEGEAKDPGADLRIAGVGPLVSLVLGAVFGLLAALVRAAGMTGLTLGVLTWLALINLVLGVFNLVPAAPLDGGRVLRALLWRRHGDRVRASDTATRAGRGFGFGLIALGVTLTILIPASGGLWLALVGWFISAASRSEEQRTRVRHALQDLQVQDVMTPDPATAPTGLDVARLLDEHVLRQRFSAFPVVDASGATLGLVTLQRIKQVPPHQRAATPIDRILHPLDEVVRAAPTDPLLDVVAPMTTSDAGRALVFDGGRLVGILSPTDVARALDLGALRAGSPASPPR